MNWNGLFQIHTGSKSLLAQYHLQNPCCTGVQCISWPVCLSVVLFITPVFVIANSSGDTIQPWRTPVNTHITITACNPIDVSVVELPLALMARTIFYSFNFTRSECFKEFYRKKSAGILVLLRQTITDTLAITPSLILSMLCWPGLV